jgi:hypothetical protein
VVRSLRVGLGTSLALIGVLFVSQVADAEPRSVGASEFECPSATGPREAPAGEQFDAKRLVGKSVGRARKVAARHGCELRVVKRDGEWLPGTDDFRTDRINVVVVEKHIKRIDGVY